MVITGVIVECGDGAVECRVFVTFEADTFKKGSAVLLKEGVQNIRLDGLLTLIAMTYGRLAELITLTRYKE